MLLLHRRLLSTAVHAALDAAERVGAVGPALVTIEARGIADGRRPAGIPLERSALRRFDGPAATLKRHDALLTGGAR